jgi:hypothetical protein
MPITYRILPDQRLVWAEARGTILAGELFEYQRTVWSRPEVQGFDELVDMTAVTEIPDPSHASLRTLAVLSAGMDAPAGHSKFAIVAPDDLAFGLGRMYQTLRGLLPQGNKEVVVFRAVTAALEWLGREDPGLSEPPVSP